FSGYSDMAIGVSRMFGIDLMRNFRMPYLAIGFRDFWARWHISLSTWFRDYVYIPLGGNRCGSVRWIVNLLLVFTVSGLWHGARWTFVLWGLLHGVLVVGELMLGWWMDRMASNDAANRSVPSNAQPGDQDLRRPTDHPPKRRHGLMQRILHGAGVLFTFHVVLVTWVFFRCESYADLCLVLRTLFTGSGGFIPALAGQFTAFELVVAAMAMAWMFLIEMRYQGDVGRWVHRRPRQPWWAVVLVTLLLVLNFGLFDSPKSFVYFQF
ncbi:MAG: MBOAT family O-acyltransferase, partial [Planctomycetota bacterium]